TDVKHFYLQTHMVSLQDYPVDELNALFEHLEGQALAEAREEGFDTHTLELHRQLDLRYPYQGYELTVPCQSEPLTEAGKERIRDDFDRLHQEVYGTSARDEIPQVVNVRVVSVSEVPKLRERELPAGGTAPDAALAGHRRALFEEHGEYVDTPIYRREKLRAGNVVEGPAIVEQLDSTTVILPRHRAEGDRYGTLTIAGRR